MKILICSDNRYPTNLDYPGHGLGRSLARLGMGLAKRKHDVHFMAGPGSFVEGCTFETYETPEQDWFTHIATYMQNYLAQFDAIIDGTHSFTLAKLKPDLPIVCKVADAENPAPYRRVYGTRALFEYVGDGKHAEVVPEGIDIDNIPFFEGERLPRLLWTGLKSAVWKKPQVAIEIAKKANLPITMLGNGEYRESLPEYTSIYNMPGMSGESYYKILGTSFCLVQPVPSMAQLEAAATGTPSLGMWKNDDWLVSGLTGFKAYDAEQAASLLTKGLGWALMSQFDNPKMRKQMREWVADNRSLTTMAKGWEDLLIQAADKVMW